jgi:hypothetical protein
MLLAASVDIVFPFDLISRHTVSEYIHHVRND